MLTVRSFLAITVTAVLATGCGDSTDPTLTLPSELERIAGHGQAAVVGTAISTGVSVRVLNTHGNPLQGVSVTWTITGGAGSTGAATSTTGADGVASTSWTLGTTAGANTLTASVDGVDALAFQATGAADAPATIEVQSGAGQTGDAGLALDDPVVVLVRDQYGNATPFVSIAWAVTAGGGSIDEEDGETLTDAAGLTQVTWTLGPVAGVANTLTASKTGLTPASVSGTSTVGAPAIVSALSGDGQTAAVTEQLPQPLVVKVTDQFGNAIAGVEVVWFIFGSVTLSEPTSTTDANGIASVIATFGTVAGRPAIYGEVGTVSGGFLLHATHAEPTILTAFSGAELTGTANSLRLVYAKLTDDYDNPVYGVTINWVTGAGSGTVEAVEGDTNIIGQSIARWTFGPTPGTQTLTASALGLSVQYTATISAAGASPE